MSSAKGKTLGGLRHCPRCPHRLEDFWQHTPEVPDPESTEENQDMNYQEDDESIASQERPLEIRGPRLDGDANDTLGEDAPDSTIGSDSIKIAAISSYGDISAESGISCLTSAEEMTYRIPCGRCCSFSYKPEMWFDGPEGTTTLGRCSKCSSAYPMGEPSPSYDDLVGRRLYFEEPSLMRQNAMMMV